MRSRVLGIGVLIGLACAIAMGAGYSNIGRTTGGGSFDGNLDGSSLCFTSPQPAFCQATDGTTWGLYYDGVAKATVDQDGRVVRTVTLDDATGDEYALKIETVTNKSTSGDDYLFYGNVTDTASPGSSYLLWLGVGGTPKLRFFNSGTFALAGSLSVGSGEQIATDKIVAAGSVADLSLAASATGQILMGTTGGPVNFGTAPFVPTHSPTSIYAQGSAEFGGDVDLGAQSIWHDGANSSAIYQDGNTLVIDPASNTDTILLDGVVETATTEVCYTFAPSAAVLGPTAPSSEVCGTYSCLGFDADAESVLVEQELPDGFVGTTGTFKIYWTNEATDAIANGETVKMDISYRSLDLGTGTTYDSGAAGTGTVTYTEAASPGTDKDTHLSTIAVTGLAAGDVFGASFDRDVATDTYSGELRVIQWELCFDINMIPNHL